MSDHPQVLYKYTSPIGIRCLQNLQIKVTPPNELNDPFEFYPRIDGTYTDAEIEEDLRDRMLWEALRNEGFLGFSFSDFEYSFPDNKAEVVTYIKYAWPLKTEISARQGARFFGLKFGIYCLSANCTHQLMWSHYADNKLYYTRTLLRSSATAFLFRILRWGLLGGLGLQAYFFLGFSRMTKSLSNKALHGGATIVASSDLTR